MKNNSKPWTNSELAMLRSMYATHDNKTLALYTGHNVNAVQYMAGKLGLRKPHRGCRKSVWEEWRLEHLRQHFADTPTKVLAERLGISIAVINKMAKQLGLHKNPRNKRFFTRNRDKVLSLTPEGEAYLRYNFPTTRNRELMSAMGISETVFLRFVRQLGLKKSKEHISRCAMDTLLAIRQRYREQGYTLNGNALPNAEKHQFRKGHPPVEILGPEKEAYRLQRVKETREQRRRERQEP